VEEVFHRFEAHGKHTVGLDNLVLLDCMNEASQGGFDATGSDQGKSCSSILAEQKP
jgi:hypothetical protein